MWTPLNNADVLAQEIVKLAQHDPEWAANRILQVIQHTIDDEKFRQHLFKPPVREEPT